MAGAIVVIREQAYDAARVFDPAIRVGLAITLLNKQFTPQSTGPS